MQSSTTNLLPALNRVPIVAEIPVKKSVPDVASLTAGIRAGDEESFREFHQLYFDRLYQFLLVIARGNEDEARDALQETLLRVVRYARKFERRRFLELAQGRCPQRGARCRPQAASLFQSAAEVRVAFRNSFSWHGLDSAHG